MDLVRPFGTASGKGLYVRVVGMRAISVYFASATTYWVEGLQ